MFATRAEGSVGSAAPRGSKRPQTGDRSEYWRTADTVFDAVAGPAAALVRDLMSETTVDCAHDLGAPEMYALLQATSSALAGYVRPGDSGGSRRRMQRVLDHCASLRREPTCGSFPGVVGARFDRWRRSDPGRSGAVRDAYARLRADLAMHGSDVGDAMSFEDFEWVVFRTTPGACRSPGSPSPLPMPPSVAEAIAHDSKRVAAAAERARNRRSWRAAFAGPSPSSFFDAAKPRGRAADGDYDADDPDPDVAVFKIPRRTSEARGCVRARRAASPAALAVSAPRGADIAPWTERVRPRVLADVVGNAALVRRLAAVVESARRDGTPVPSLVMCGPSGSGKTTIARAFAAALFEGRDGCSMCELDCDALVAAARRASGSSLSSPAPAPPPSHSLHADEWRVIAANAQSVAGFCAVARASSDRTPAPHRVVFLDEVDGVADASDASELARVVRAFGPRSHNGSRVAFVAACNSTRGAHPDVMASFDVVEFLEAPTDADVRVALGRVARSVGVPDPPAWAVDAAVTSARGDVRRAISTLEAMAGSGFAPLPERAPAAGPASGSTWRDAAEEGMRLAESGEVGAFLEDAIAAASAASAASLAAAAADAARRVAVGVHPALAAWPVFAARAAAAEVRAVTELPVRPGTPVEERHERGK